MFYDLALASTSRTRKPCRKSNDIHLINEWPNILVSLWCCVQIPRQIFRQPTPSPPTATKKAKATTTKTLIKSRQVKTTTLRLINHEQSLTVSKHLRSRNRYLAPFSKNITKCCVLRTQLSIHMYKERACKLFPKCGSRAKTQLSVR